MTSPWGHEEPETCDTGEKCMRKLVQGTWIGLAKIHCFVMDSHQPPATSLAYPPIRTIRAVQRVASSFLVTIIIL